MAYGVRWFSEFDDIQANVVYRVEVQERDYGGSETEVLSGGNPLIIETVSVDNVYAAIRPQKATVEWMAEEGVDFQISDLFITDDKKYRLQVFRYQDGSPQLRWSGFLVPIECEEPFASKPYPVTFAATCGLPFLSDDYVLTQGGSFVEGKQSLINVIANCLVSTGLELNIETYIDLYETGMSTSQSPLSQAEIDADGLRGKKAGEVLEGILAPFGAFITQSRSRWVIKGLHEQNSTTAYRYTFNSAGTQVSAGNDIQLASIGRIKYTDNIPNLRPTSEVVERLAEPNSIVTETVSPGIPVNRLPNGLFSGPVLGGTIPGWNNHIGSIPWSRAGFNTPEDPYRLEMYSHIEFDPKKKKRAFKPFYYWDSGAITFNLGDFNIPADRRKETKIVLGGAFKSNNSLSATFMLSINETEREFNDYLDDSGEWFYSKKEDRTYNKRSNQSKYEPSSKGYNDLELQEFEIESKKITNLLNRSEGALAVLRLRIFPAIQGPGYNGGNIFYSLEDLYLIVVEDTVYEGEHQYQADGHLPIRNANEAEYTSIIADKIDITTPEQSRDVNRVMTGYMTLVGGTQLTKEWKYSDDSTAEPIQKRSLRDRTRLLCGKRRIIDGTFIGYDLTPDKPVFSRYDDPSAPATYYTQMGWKWDVKNAFYDTTLHELDFSPLADEDIYLFDDENGRRGNRMYRGNSSSGTGGASKPQEEAIVFDDIPPVYFTVGLQEIKVVDLLEYLASSHASYTLSDRELHYDDWVSYVVIDRGEDGTLLDLQITAWPKEPGTDRVLVEFEGPNGEKLIVIVPLVAYPAIKIKSTLLEIAGFSPTVLGPIPGFYEKSENPFDISTKVTGHHLKVEMFLTGFPSVIQEVEFTETGVYRYFLESGGYVLEPGQYKYTVDAYRDELVSKSETVTFVIYDEEYLAALKAILTSVGAVVGEISLDGTSVFDNLEGFNPRVVIDGVEHDKALLQLTQDGELVPDGSQEFTLEDPDTNETYDLFLNDQPLLGKYTLTVTAYLEDEEVLSRFFDFEVSKKKPKPTGGELQLLAKSAGGSNFTVLATLPKTGVSAHTLPAPGWNIGCDAESDPFDWEGDQLAEFKGEKLVEVSIPTYIGRPSFIEYNYPITSSDYRAFDNFSSVDIGKIHGNNKTFRYIRTRKLGGPSGEVVAIYQADFSFGTLVAIDEDAEVEEPGSDIVDYVAGAAMRQITEDSIRRFDTAADEESLTVIEPLSPHDPASPSKNHLAIKEGGVQWDFHLADLPADTVLGRMDTAGPPQAIPIKKINSGLDPDDLITVGVIEDLIEDALEGSIDGTPNFFAKFGTDGHSLVDGVMREISGNVGIGITPLEKFHISGNVRASGQFISDIATGTAPFVVSSSTKVTNLHADFVGRNVIAGTGLTGGGILTADRTLAFDTTWGDARYLTASSTNTNMAWDLVNGTTVPKFNLNATNGPLGSAQVHGLFMPHGVQPYGTAIAFRNGQGFFRTNEAGVWGSWLQFADRTWVNAKQILTGTGLLGGGNLSADRTLTFDTTWGDARYALIGRLISAGTGLTGGGSLAADRTLSFDTTWGDARYLTISSTNTSLAWNSVNTTLTPKFNINSTDGPLGGAQVHGLFMPHGVQNYGTSIAFRNGQGFFKTLESGVWGSWFQFADRGWVDAKIISAGVGLTGGGDFSTNRTISMGTPSTLSNATTNSASGTTHTHAIQVSNLVAGTNVSFSASGTGVILGGNNITISVNSFPWPNLTLKPTTLADLGVTDIYDKPQIDFFLGGKENNFAKGNIIQGSNVSLSGTLTNRLVGSGDVTIAVTAVPWSIITGKPNSISGYGITDGATLTDLSTGLAGKENSFSKGSLIQGTGISLSGSLTSRLVGSGDVTVGLATSGVSAGTYTSVTVDAYGRVTGGSNPGGAITGSGLFGRVAVWGGTSSLVASSILQDSGTQLSVNGHLVVTGGGFAMVSLTSLPSVGAIDGDMRYSSGSYFYWQDSTSTWKKIETI